MTKPSAAWHAHGLLRVAQLLLLLPGQASSQAPRSGASLFDGPFPGLPLPDLRNRRCGHSCGANDTTSSMWCVQLSDPLPHG
eukprot:COSAG05_NODE_264_length_12674_cov_6.768111_1_plen_82_part_00